MGTINHLQVTQLQLGATPLKQKQKEKKTKGLPLSLSNFAFVTVRHNSCDAYWLSGLTVFGPGLDGHRAGVKGERVVKQVDFTVDLRA